MSENSKRKRKKNGGKKKACSVLLWWFKKKKKRVNSIWHLIRIHIYNSIDTIENYHIPQFFNCGESFFIVKDLIKCESLMDKNVRKKNWGGKICMIMWQQIIHPIVTIYILFIF